jgi:signal transduction histidine kinase
MEAGKRIALLAGLEDLLPNLASEARRIARADAAAVLAPRDDAFVVASAVGLESLEGRTIPAKGSLAGWVAQMGEPAVVANVDEASPSWEKEYFRPSGYRAHLFLPLEWAGKRLAVLSLHSRAERDWSPREVSLLDMFLGLAAVALANAGLYKEAEERARALVQLNRQLEEALKLKKNFLATISHELRTPLQIIIGYAELMRDQAFGEPAGEMHEAIEKILRQSSCLQALIESLLDLSEIERGRIELRAAPVRLRDLLDESASKARRLLGNKPVVLRCHYRQPLPDLFTDGRRLAQVLDHLLENAVKFTERGEIMLQAAARDGVVEISLRDTGIGIRAEDQEIIFDEFRQVEEASTRRHGGTGHGLYLVRRLAELLGGTITVSSELGCGSLFRLSLPLGEPPDARRPPEDEAAETLTKPRFAELR